MHDLRAVSASSRARQNEAVEANVSATFIEGGQARSRSGKEAKVNTTKQWRESVIKLFARRSIEKVIGDGCGDGFVCVATNGHAGLFVQGAAKRENKNTFVALTDGYTRYRVTGEDRLRWASSASNKVRVLADKTSPFAQRKYLAPITVLSGEVFMHVNSDHHPVIFTFRQKDIRYVVMPMRVEN